MFGTVHSPRQVVDEPGGEERHRRALELVDPGRGVLGYSLCVARALAAQAWGEAVACDRACPPLAAAALSARA